MQRINWINEDDRTYLEKDGRRYGWFSESLFGSSFRVVVAYPFPWCGDASSEAEARSTLLSKSEHY
ncbi:MAG: hypothetical protein ACRC62_34930 [Microcoleus sp.]